MLDSLQIEELGSVPVFEAVATNIDLLGDQMTDQERPTSTLQLFLDESGKLADSSVVAYGGCVAAGSQAISFSRKWEQFLKDADVKSTSMKEAVHFQGPYRTWKDQADAENKRDALLRSLANLLVSDGLLLISAPMKRSDFVAMPLNQRGKFWQDLHYCGFEACLTGVLHKVPRSRVHVICDLSEQYAEKCLTLFNKIRNRDPLAKDRCTAITFADDEDLPTLQAADMIAFCSRADEMRDERAPEPITEELISILHTHDRQRGDLVYYADGDGLGHGEVEGL